MQNKLSPEELRQLFEERGIKFPKDRHKIDAEKIQEIGYYKLKEFAYPFSTYNNNNKSLEYQDLSFKKLIKRYYLDKNLRIHILHAIEDIEVNLNSVLTTMLGNKYGPFGYLNFQWWCNKEDFSKFYIEEKQLYFKKQLRKRVVKSSSVSLNLKNNKNKDNFPTVWLMGNTLTFGSTTFLIKLMSKQNKIKIANHYNCNAIELISWLECLNLVRNICAHNSNLIDLKLKTMPMVPKAYEDYIYKKDGINYSNSLALIICVIKKLMTNINPKYKFGNITDSIKKAIFIDDVNAIDYGFVSLESIKKLKNR